MNNAYIITAVHEIVSPYFKFNIEDIYGDKGGNSLPNIDDLRVLFFKLIGNHHICSIKKREELVRDVRELDVGYVELVKIGGIGYFISITIPCHDDNEYMLK